MSLMTISFDLDFDFGELRRWLEANGLLHVAIGDYTRDQIVTLVRHILAETTVRKEGVRLPWPGEVLSVPGVTPFAQSAAEVDEVPF